MNPVQILMMNQQKSKVLGYGLLYNWYAISNANFAPTGWKVPTLTEWNTLFTNVGGTSVAGKHLKESGKTHWDTPGGDNSSNFTALGGALRTVDTSGDSSGWGNFTGAGNWWTSSETSSTNASYIGMISTSDAVFNMYNYSKRGGLSVRLLYTQEGSPTSVTDYDGNVYPVVQIGSQYWIKQNWKCTHLNDGTSIPEVTDSTKWAGLTTGALCAYDNDWENV